MTRPITFRVLSNAPPQWAAESLAVNSGWTPIAGGANWPGLADWQRGGRIVDDAPSPVPQYETGNYGDIIRSWNGGSVDPVRKEMLLVANGGHANYAGNEAYALQLDQPVPAWKRLCDPTPAPSDWFESWTPEGIFTTADTPRLHLDGRTRALHTSGSPQYANGRVWFPFQTSVTCGAGTSQQGVISFDRDGVAQLPGDFAPWTPDNPFPYQAHGIAGVSGNQTNYSFCSSAYDPVDGVVWYYAQSYCWGVNVATGVVDRPPRLTGKNFTSTGSKGAWVVCLPDQRKILIGLSRTAGQPIWVHDLTRPPGDPNEFILFTTANSNQNALTWDPDSYWYNWADPGTENDGGQSGNNVNYAVLTNPYHYDVFNYGMGAAYSGGLVYVGPVPCRPTGTLGGNVHVLNPITMTWTVLTNTGERIPPLMGCPQPAQKPTQNGNFQRFNMVEWTTVRLLIHAADVYGPSHVWRIS